MPEFSYQIKDAQNKITSGTLTALSADEAASILHNQGSTIVSLKSPTKLSALGKVNGNIPTVEKANLCRYLATMIGAGLPLAEAVDTITQDTKSKTLKNVLGNVQYGLQQGESLSELFGKYPRIFDPVFLSIVKAGEQSGTLQRSFQYLEDQLMANHALSQKVKGALLYPAVIIATMFGVGGILIVFVIPQIAQVFLKTKLAIPRLTVFILQTGLAINQHLALIGGILGLLVVALIIITRSRTGKKFLTDVLKRLPLVSGLFEKLDLARFARTLATLMQSGVPITQSISVATSTLSHAKFHPLVVSLETDIKKGESISSVLRHHKHEIPQMMISMVATGEKTGTTDKILFDVANFYEQELENDVKNFTAILEPAIMLLIGVGVGGMVLSIIAPIYSLVSSLQNAK